MCAVFLDIFPVGTSKKEYSIWMAMDRSEYSVRWQDSVQKWGQNEKPLSWHQKFQSCIQVVKMTTMSQLNSTKRDKERPRFESAKKQPPSFILHLDLKMLLANFRSLFFSHFGSLQQKKRKNLTEKTKLTQLLKKREPKKKKMKWTFMKITEKWLGYEKRDGKRRIWYNGTWFNPRIWSIRPSHKSQHERTQLDAKYIQYKHHRVLSTSSEF